MKRFKRFDKRLLPMLFIGLGIWGASIGVTALLESSGTLDGQSALMEMGKMMYQKMPVFTLLLLCLLQPVFEEFSFRLWGVGKTWMTIVCLALMTLFGVSEMGLWMLLFVGAFLFVWLKVKDAFRQRWLLALITSLCFALCHISGFGSFGWGMVLGLLDIFGMALVMCWLTINLSFWFSCLLHVLNNSLAIIIPMAFLPTTVTNTYTFDDVQVETELSGVKMFAELPDLADSTGWETYVGEPAEVAEQILADIVYFENDRDYAAGPYYDWLSVNESMEERIVYKARVTPEGGVHYSRLLECFLKDYEAYNERTLVFDTTEMKLLDINLVYLFDSSRVNINDEGIASGDFDIAFDRVTKSRFGRATRRIVPYAGEEDSVVLFYALPTTRKGSILEDMMKDYEEVFDAVYGFRMEYAPTGKKVKLITVSEIKN